MHQEGHIYTRERVVLLFLVPVTEDSKEGFDATGKFSKICMPLDKTA